MVGREHADALVKILQLLDSFPEEIREWVLVQIGSNEVQTEVQRTSSNGAFEPALNQIEPVHAPAFEQGVSRFFLQFWSVYPRKQGKKEALRIYQKLKPNQEFQDRILHAVHEQKASEQWTKDEGQFIPLPKTWLNRGSWDDEPVHAPVQNRFGRTSSKVFERFIERGSKELPSGQD